MKVCRAREKFDQKIFAQWTRGARIVIPRYVSTHRYDVISNESLRNISVLHIHWNTALFFLSIWILVRTLDCILYCTLACGAVS